ncbi:conserved hypothetical protein [Vibrio owensii]|jgi:hypothetical protein|uniref:Uncharacterized protein n=1 Tax=Vibrio jasicida TaxID=766224 RepID=A0AAU9QPM2_9VIBR|nr:conserved hypothetical protein [Vibrio owensii]CAH1564800.1 conserved hypothetical protein [Vibrio owensii]CAH1593841.1 conserved hypothetical protein [Vibrio jasicida]CAH1597821.1 conserved hypothetical protein [Vibrio jasicida]
MPDIDSAALFFAEDIDALERFLKSPLSCHMHIYCHCEYRTLKTWHIQWLSKRDIQSVSFFDSHTIYPPFT